MSVAVALDALTEHIREFGGHPHLVTVGADGHAHVVSTAAAFHDGTFEIDAGRTTRTNVATNAAVTLLWTRADGPYSLIVDGDAQLLNGGETIQVRPTRAVLHRLAGASTDLPSCVPIEADPAEAAPPSQ